MRFRKKPVEIEARQLTADTGAWHGVYLWVEENTLGSFEPLGVIEGRVPCPASGVSIDPRDGRMMIATLEGPHHANLGDWIILTLNRLRCHFKHRQASQLAQRRKR